MEIWKDIYGYEDSYSISNHGRVKSKEREVFRRSKNGNMYKVKVGGFILKNICHKSGYARVVLMKDGKAKQENVHRLVANHFINNPLNLPQVNHIDGNKHNPHVSNLEWVTPIDNGKHAYSSGLSYAWNKGLLGNQTGKYRGVYQVSPHGKVKKLDCMSDATRDKMFDSGGITKCCQKKIASHKGFIWIYEDDFSEEEKAIRMSMLPDKIKRISNTGDVKIYNSLSEASRDGFNRTGIIGCCNGIYKTSLGYKWEYISHVEYLKHYIID